MHRRYWSTSVESAYANGSGRILPVPPPGTRALMPPSGLTDCRAPEALPGVACTRDTGGGPPGSRPRGCARRGSRLGEGRRVPGLGACTIRILRPRARAQQDGPAGQLGIVGLQCTQRDAGVAAGQLEHHAPAVHAETRPHPAQSAPRRRGSRRVRRAPRAGRPPGRSQDPSAALRSNRDSG
jgi:hypothetical protein